MCYIDWCDREIIDSYMCGVVLEVMVFDANVFAVLYGCIVFNFHGGGNVYVKGDLRHLGISPEVL